MENLVSKICALMSEIGNIPKNGYNKAQNYHYRTHADIMSGLRPLLVKHKLVIYPKGKILMHQEKFQTKSGASMFKVITNTMFVITDGKDNIEFQGIGEGADSMDKAVYKSQTGGAKYALNDIFMLASEDDPENENGNGNSTPPPNQTVKPSQQPSGDQKSQMKDLMDQMGYSEAKQSMRFKKAEDLGDKVVMDELQAEYKKTGEK